MKNIEKRKVDRDLKLWARGQIDDSGPETRLTSKFFDNNLKRIQTILKKLGRKRTFNILFYSYRSELFDIAGMSAVSGGPVESVTFCTSEAELWSLDRKFDVAIVCTHLSDDHLPQLVMRARKLASLIISWTWDNHQNHFKNICDICLSDIVLPSHDFCADKLKSPFYLLGNSFPLCTTQWSQEESGKFLSIATGIFRSDALHGGYIMWKGVQRNKLLRALKEQVPENQINLIDVSMRDAYFAQSPEDRFREWSSHKVSIQIPYANDLSQRVFDALFAGQIPIVPDSCHDLDRVVPRDIQESLPILRIKDVSVASVITAWKLGLEHFDNTGLAGIRQRHDFALNYHHISERVLQIVRYVAGLKHNLNVGLSINNDGIGLVDRS